VRFLFDLGHPAHYYLFKHSMRLLRDAGHEVILIARQKDCLPDLIRSGGWPCHLIPRKKRNLPALGVETLRGIGLAVSISSRRAVDLMIGTSMVVGPAARLAGAISLVFEEDDAAVVPLFARLAYPPAHYVVTPECLKFENYGRKHLTYRGYHELAYLHPQRYRPDPQIRRDLGLRDGERHFLIRLVALTAHHDVGQRGLTPQQAWTLVDLLGRRGRVFISAEGHVDDRLGAYLLRTRPEQVLDVMAYADMVIGDGQTMAAEAAVLGIPGLRCNTFVGRLSYLEELEHKYGLTKGFLPSEFESLVNQANAWLAQDDLKAQWLARRDAMLRECIDVTGWMTDLFLDLARRRRQT